MKNLCFLILFFFVGYAVAEDIDWGVTYSYPQALWLCDGDELFAKKILSDIINELGIKNYRLEAYWNWLQGDSASQLDLSSIDWQLEKVAGSKTVILCIGRKVPRWSEYHIPEWAKKMTEKELKQALLNYLAMVVKKYSNDPRITHWQVENEPLFSFGESEPFFNRRFKDQENFLVREIEVVRLYDKLNRQIIVTDSGDKGRYRETALNADILGLSYYGIIHKKFGYFPNAWLYTKLFRIILRLPPWNMKAIAEYVEKPVWLIELQAEPWGPEDTKFLSDEEIAKSMQLRQLQHNIKVVRNAGFKNIYFWGAEWWSWMRKKGHSEIWDAMRHLIATNPAVL